MRRVSCTTRRPASNVAQAAQLHKTQAATLQATLPRCIYAAHAIPVFVRVKLSLHTNSNKQTKGQLVKLSILHIAGRASLTAFVKVHQKAIATGRMFVLANISLNATNTRSPPAVLNPIRDNWTVGSGPWGEI